MNRRELKERVDVLEARLKWLTETRPNPPEGARDFILRETDVWQYGITELVDGTFSSVWMKVKHG